MADMSIDSKVKTVPSCTMHLPSIHTWLTFTGVCASNPHQPLDKSGTPTVIVKRLAPGGCSCKRAGPKDHRSGMPSERDH